MTAETSGGRKFDWKKAAIKTTAILAEVVGPPEFGNRLRELRGSKLAVPQRASDLLSAGEVVGAVDGYVGGSQYGLGTYVTLKIVEGAILFKKKMELRGDGPPRPRQTPRI